MLSKNEHRQRLILLRNELGITRNKTLSLSIQQTFLAEFESNPSVQTIGLYAPTNVEVQLDLISKKFIDMGRTITWPVIRPNYSLRFIAINQTKKFTTNPFDILEPVDGDTIAPQHHNIIIVPSIGVDNFGHRIGYGGGYYDRALSSLRRLKKRPLLVGVICGFQKIDANIGEAHDIKLDCVCTETKVEWF